MRTMTVLMLWCFTLSSPKADGEEPRLTARDLIAALRPGDYLSVGPLRVIELTTAALGEKVSAEDQARLLWLRALAETHSGMKAQAIADYDGVLKLQPTNVDARLARALYMVDRHHVTDAELEFQRILENNPKEARALIGRAHCRAFNADLDAAEDLFRRARQIAPDDWAVTVCGASYFSVSLGGDTVIRQMTEMIDNWATNRSWLPFDLSGVYYTRAQLQYCQSRYAEALTDCRIARSLSSSEVQVANCRSLTAYCQLRLGDYAAARLVATELVSTGAAERDPRIQSTLRSTELLLTALAGSSNRAAEQALADTDAEAPGLDTFQAAAQYLILCGRYQDAATACNKFEEKYHRRWESIDSCYAYLLGACPDAAIRNADSALKLTDGYEKRYPRNSRLLMIRAIALAEAGRFDEAAKLASTATDLLPPTARLRSEYSRRVKSFQEKKPFRFDPKHPDYDVIESP